MGFRRPGQHIPCCRQSPRNKNIETMNDAEHRSQLKAKKIYEIGDIYQPLIASTEVTTGINRFNRFSIPAFKVNIDDGHPLQEPCSTTFTIPSW